MQKPLKHFLLCLSIVVAFSDVGRAGLVLHFDPIDADITLGESVDIDVVLTQTDPATPVDLTANGLMIADVQLLLDSPAAAVTAIQFGTGFEDSTFSDLSDPSMPLLSAQSIDLSGVLAPAGSPTSITIGTFTFTGIAEGTTIASTTDTGFQELIFDGINADFDNQIFGSETATIRVVAVPEPSSLTLLAMAAIGFGCRRRKR
ncbi:PEP-CTERM motif protein [Stieleria neptunia]|uniref:PEP-CTERM motif protein n=1 Tax=Stieleria neptunia TaxID=2527979 RepID=A0A518I2N0_9BACT|nr:PEP-CTERM sorting domain-containing protein [Stieleria neptunia]QDV47316.1 PEP-CTERM motif protein [Stieleria neptunia]